MTKDLRQEAMDILKIVSTSPSRLTPPALEKALLKDSHLKRKEIKILIKDLVDQGELTYTYEFGSTFLETSFNKPIRISNSVVIKPPGHQYHPKSGEIVLKIKPGASFGDGRHPTTRLAVRGVEYILKEFGSKIFSAQHRPTVLDIGTGSGILILVAVSLGIHSGVGIDIDPCARTEAKENILINDLTDRIKISDQYLETIHDSYFLVTANLRLPTLKKISPILRKIVSPSGVMVISGVRSHETEALIAKYATRGFEKLWMEVEHDWAGIVLRHSE
jgi:ribosomal protein L11 methyltransferase